MRRALAFLALSLSLAATAGRADDLQVWIDEPRRGEFVYGRIEIAAAVSGEGADDVAVEFIVDGTSHGIMVEPPYKLAVDVGSRNVAHEFVVVARSATGATARTSVRTSELQVDDQMDLRLKQFYVTATDGERRVLDLDRGDFTVLEDGDRQKIVTFERGDVPLTAVLLLDSSLSMSGLQLDAALRGASLFLEGMEELDEVKVMLYSDRLLRTSEFSGDPAVLRESLTDARAAGGTSINDHLFLGLKHLDARQGRRVVVLFSDGADVDSVLSMSEVLTKVHATQALIYWIYLRQDGGDENDVPRYSSTWRDYDANEEEFRLLRRAVEDSGGRVQVVDQLEQLDEAFVEIMRELREQYVLGYYPSNRELDGSWREVRIRVKRSGVRLRAREGYLAY